jgi:Flp pilus assembly pilin Flp
LIGFDASLIEIAERKNPRMKPFRKLRDQRGQGALEYAMILAIVMAVIIMGFKFGVFQNAVASVSNYLTGRITAATT